MLPCIRASKIVAHGAKLTPFCLVRALTILFHHRLSDYNLRTYLSIYLFSIFTHISRTRKSYLVNKQCVWLDFSVEHNIKGCAHGLRP